MSIWDRPPGMAMMISAGKIERIFARVFGAQKAYVRVQISSGTQAISAMLYGCLRPGDELLSVTGRPYDTLSATIGIGEGDHDMSLTSYGITYNEVNLKDNGEPDIEAIKRAIGPSTRMVLFRNHEVTQEDVL